MRTLKYALFVLLAGLLFTAGPKANAQVSFGVSVGGPAPVCPYGYFDYAPYDCAPYGYYGPEWFSNGVFFGAGPWFHGPHGFNGHVDNRFDPRYGYHGPVPEHNDARFNHFHGNEVRDGQGNFHNGDGNWHQGAAQHMEGHSEGGHR
jgi:hypothetical protein